METAPTPAVANPPSPLLAANFLFPSDDDRYAGAPNWQRAGAWLALWGLLIGILYAATLRITWRWFGEYQFIRFVPMSFVLAVDLGWCGYRLLSAVPTLMARRKDGGNPGSFAVNLTLPILLAILLVVIVKWSMLLSLPISAKTYPWGWRNNLGWLYPQVIYRPLVLMPLWGRWAMMMALMMGRVSGESERIKAMAQGMRLSTVMLNWLLCAVLTVLYVAATRRDIALASVIALGVMVAAYLASFLLARRFGGQSEATAGLTGLVAEFAFLILYLRISYPIYWYY